MQKKCWLQPLKYEYLLFVELNISIGHLLAFFHNILRKQLSCKFKSNYIRYQIVARKPTDLDCFVAV